MVDTYLFFQVLLRPPTLVRYPSLIIPNELILAAPSIVYKFAFGSKSVKIENCSVDKLFTGDCKISVLDVVVFAR